jgi:hypothetical protein
MVYGGLPAGRGHNAPSIRLGDLDSFIALLSLESHRHLRISIIESIVGEFASFLLTCSFVIDPFLCYIPHRPPAHPTKTAMVKRFQFDLVCT